MQGAPTGQHPGTELGAVGCTSSLLCQPQLRPCTDHLTTQPRLSPLVVVLSLNGVRLLATPQTAACQASLSLTISRSLLKNSCPLSQ